MLKPYFFEILVVFVALFAPLHFLSQLVHDNGALLNLTSSGILHSNGGIELLTTSQFTNEGTLTLTNNSSLAETGNFTCESSSVTLFGNTEQLITSQNGTITTFNICSVRFGLNTKILPEKN